jgi:predicted outer membrane repeat protein
MGKIKQIFFLAAFFCQTMVTAQIYGAIGYVKQGGTGNGTSWADASGDIQSLLNSSQYGQIWVAGGTYKPNRRADDLTVITPNNQHNAFVINGRVKIYGGFAGTETSLAQRDLSISSNESILSGDLGFENQSYDNAYHVIILTGYAVLDGLTIKDGVASCYSNNCIIVNGRAISGEKGGGIYATESNNTLMNLTIKNNWAREEGGGMYIGRTVNPETFMKMINVVFWNNSTTGKGGAIFSFLSKPKITNCVFSANYAQMGGGAICARESQASIYNTIFHNNNAQFDTRGHDIFVDDYGYPVGTVFIFPDVHYSITQFYKVDAYYNNNYVGNYQPFTDPVNGDFTLKKSAFVAYDTGTNSVPEISLPTQDKAGNLRIVNQTVDRGAFEYKSYRVMRTTNITDFKNDLLVFPNPVNDILNIETETEISSVEIYNAQGQKVKRATSKQVDLSNLKSGVHILEIRSSDGQTIKKKFIKK